MADNLTENGARGDVVGFTPDQLVPHDRIGEASCAGEDGRADAGRFTGRYGEPSALLAADEPGNDPVAEP